MNIASLAAWRRGRKKIVSGVWKRGAGLTVPLTSCYSLEENTSNVSFWIHCKIVPF